MFGKRMATERVAFLYLRLGHEGDKEYVGVWLMADMDSRSRPYRVHGLYFQDK